MAVSTPALHALAQRSRPAFTAPGPCTRLALRGSRYRSRSGSSRCHPAPTPTRRLPAPSPERRLQRRMAFASAPAPKAHRVCGRALLQRLPPRCAPRGPRRHPRRHPRSLQRRMAFAPDDFNDGNAKAMRLWSQILGGTELALLAGHQWIRAPIVSRATTGRDTDLLAQRYLVRATVVAWRQAEVSKPGKPPR